MNAGRFLSTQALAKASATHPWRTVGIWVAMLAAAMVLNITMLSDTLTTEFGFSNDPDSLHASALLENRLRGPRLLNEIIVVQSVDAGVTVEDPEFKEVVERLHADLMALGPEVIAGGVSYYLTGNESMVSADRRATFLPFTMAGEVNDATANAEELLAVIDAANEDPAFYVGTVGEASIAFESNEISTADIKKGESIGVSMALLILVFLFGALLAALIPLALAAIAIIVAFGATAIVGQFVELIFFVTLMITMIGLAVGIDYSLIVVSRYREELRKGRNTLDAIAQTGATASRTVFFSGMTVVVALVGMLIVPATVFQGLAMGAILVVLAAVAASLTLLPAVLSLMGNKVNVLRVPFLGRLTNRGVDASGGGFWGWVTRVIMANPVVSLLLMGGLMIAAAVPYLDINTGFNGVDTFPDGVQSKEAFLVLEEQFSFGVAAPTEIVIDGDVNSAAVQAGIERLQAVLATDQDFGLPSPFQVNPAGDLGTFSVAVTGEPAGERAVDAVARLREVYIPAAFGGVDAEVLVTGITAFNSDFFTIVDTYTPIVFAIVLGLSLLLLTVVFRSIVIPVKSIILNLLSVGAAYGLLVLVFQKGIGADFLGFHQTETIDAWIPLFLFSVLFGLSMDYHVFLLSRIRERYDETHDNAESVAFGLRSTAGLITGAALIMVAVFSGFAMGDMVGNQQVGFGLAVAIFLDATVVRSILVPASMRLLGPLNWYFPRRLEWLPRIGIERQRPSAAPAAEAD